MLIIIKENPEITYVPELKKADPNCQEFTVQEKTDKELLAMKPDVILLVHRDAANQARELRNSGHKPYFRILVLLQKEYAGEAIEARIAGADSVLIDPIQPSDLRHAVRNESAAARRWRDGEKTVAAKTVIGKQYELTKFLGISLRASVFLATDLNSRKTVTVKVIRKMVAKQTECMEEYLSVARKIAQARAFDMPDLLEIGTWDSAPFLVYDLGEAKNMYQMLRERDLPELELLRIALAATRALYTLKQHKIFHLNVKPENILFYNGRYYLADFGILPELSSPIDNTGFPYWSDPTFSSPEFFSPEATLTARTDVYSLGLVLFTLAVKNNPYFGYPYKIAYQRHQRPTRMISFPDKTAFSSSFITTVYSMVMLRQDARPFLRDLEIVFSLSLKLRSGPATAKPVETIDSLLERTRQQREAERKTSLITPGETGILETHADDDQIQQVRSAAKKIPDKLSTRILEYTLENWKKILWIGAGVPVLFLLAFYLGKMERKPIYFNQGKLTVFTCYAGHTHTGRTLDFRTVRCKQCGDRTSESYTCRSCRKVFGLSLWPLRDMNEQECAAFEEKQSKCPYCKSKNILPTPIRNLPANRKKTK